MLTVYGIETDMATNHHVYRFKLQQCLPFTVLKLDIQLLYLQKELTCCNSAYRLRYWNETISITEPNLSPRCNSAYRLRYWNSLWIQRNCWPQVNRCNSAYRLRYWNRLQDVVSYADERLKLQQYLPFTVLKLNGTLATSIKLKVATALTIYGVCWRIWGTREVA